MPGYGGSAPLATVVAAPADALQEFAGNGAEADPGRASIGGMIVQQWWRSIRIRACRGPAQTSPAFGKADGDWQKSFIGARLGPLDRGETMVSLALNLVKELVGDDPDARGMALARECMASVPEATYRAMMLALLGFDQRNALKDIKVPTLLLSGSKDNNAPAPMMAKMATYVPSAKYVELDGVGHLANLERPGAFNAALDQFLKADVAATQVTAS
jgi:3-oxoadipate enol-lactonase